MWRLCREGCGWGDSIIQRLMCMEALIRGMDAHAHTHTHTFSVRPFGVGSVNE